MRDPGADEGPRGVMKDPRTDAGPHRVMWDPGADEGPQGVMNRPCQWLAKCVGHRGVGPEDQGQRGPCLLD